MRTSTTHLNYTISPFMCGVHIEMRIDLYPFDRQSTFPGNDISNVDRTL